jgi:hypothetical protein
MIIAKEKDRKKKKNPMHISPGKKCSKIFRAIDTTKSALRVRHKMSPPIETNRLTNITKKLLDVKDTFPPSGDVCNRKITPARLKVNATKK